MKHFSTMLLVLFLFARSSPALSFQTNNSLLMAPIMQLGQSRTAIISKLGRWISLETKTIVNRHDPDQKDNIYTIKYDGLILRVYRVAKHKKEMLVSVTMTKNYPRILPELIGLTRNVIESRYGTAKQVKGETFKYAIRDEIGENSMIIKYENNILMQIDWSYYVD
jgi:hypothetical protein